MGWGGCRWQEIFEGARCHPSVSFQSILQERFTFVRWRVDIEVKLLFSVRKDDRYSKAKVFGGNFDFEQVIP